MATNISSPSVTLNDKDSSQYVTTSSSTIVAFVGYATNGPIGVPTLITSKSEFIATFGAPPVSAPWSHLAVYRAFNQTDKVLFVRVADTTTTKKALQASVAILNDSPATAGYQTLSATLPVTYGSYVSGSTYALKITPNGGSAFVVPVDAPVTGDFGLPFIASQINSALNTAKAGYQEFSYDFYANASLSLPRGTYLRFGVTKDGSAFSASNDFEVYLTPAMSATDVVNAFQSSLKLGAAPASKIVFNSSITGDVTASSPSFTASTQYSIKIGGTEVSITTPASLTGYTWQSFVNDMNAAIGNNTTLAGNGIHAFLDTTGVVFGSTLYGTTATTAVALTAGTTGTDLTTFTGTGKFTATGTLVAIAGVVGYSTNAPIVSVNSTTYKLRLTSNTTGASSSILITSPVLGNVGAAVSIPASANSAIQMLGGLKQKVTGTAAVAGMTAYMDADSGKIKVVSGLTGTTSTIALANDATAADSITAPTLTTGAFTSSVLMGVLTSLLGTDTAVAGLAGILATSKDNIEFYSKNSGADNNKVSVVFGSTVDGFTGSNIYSLKVYYDGAIKETFSGVSLVPTDSKFFATVLNTDVSNGGSSYVNVNYIYRSTPGTNIQLAAGTYTLGAPFSNVGLAAVPYSAVNNYLGSYGYKVGTDGIPTSGGTALFTAALGTDGALANTEMYDFRVLATPDTSSEEVQNAALKLYSARNGDFLYVADPPFGKTYTQVVDWHNGRNGQGRTTAINSDGAAIYWPWLLEYNNYTDQNVWCPPSVFVVEKYIENDNKYSPWVAVAGDTRGTINANGYETSPSLAQRNYIYGGLNAINPIVNFKDKGLEIYGQKTAYRVDSSLNRVNVKRLQIYIKKLIKKAMESFVFESNTPDTLNRMTNYINGILEPVRQKNGISAYKVAFKSDDNNPNLANGTVKFVPVGSLEFIGVDIEVMPTGATIK